MDIDKLLRAVGLDFEGALEAFTFSRESRGVKQDTISGYIYKLKDFKEFINLPPKDITSHHLGAFLHYLQTEKRNKKTGRKITDKTIKGYIRTLKAFFGFLTEEGYIETNPAQRIKMPRISQHIIPTFSGEQIQALLKASKPNLRDYAIILTLLDTGIRVTELCNLDLSDVDWVHNLLLIRLGKGSKDRQVPFGRGLKRALWRWATKRRFVEAQEALFIGRAGERFTRSGVYKMLKEYAIKSRIKGVRVSPHTFRHTFAKFWILNGGDAFSLQRILGHTTMEMVRNYVNLFTQDLSALHRKFSPVDRLSP